MLGNISSFFLPEVSFCCPSYRITPCCISETSQGGDRRLDSKLALQWCITYFKQHLHYLSGSDLSSRCKCSLCLRQPLSVKGSASSNVLNFVYNLDQFELSCNTTYNQYVYAVNSESLSVEQIALATFPSITADYRFQYYLPKQKFHIDHKDTDCLPPDGQELRVWYGSKMRKFV